MTGSEALAARCALGLSQNDLASETGTTPSAVAAWEVGKIKVPRHVAVDLAWRVARNERLAALEASGLPECAWVRTFEAEPIPEKLDAQTKRLDRLIDHSKTCEVCRARDKFIEGRFPPMPPAPRHGWLAIALPIAEQIQRLPEWAQPAATGAVLFIAYSLIKLIFLLPAIARAPAHGLLTAIEGMSMSGSIGAVLGFLYGQYRRLRQRGSSRGTA